MGDKASAKSTMIEAGVPCFWFSRDFRVIQTQKSQTFGYPVMLKQLQVVVEKECVPFGKKKIY
jgi:biotin carboxylase